jgi:hypothetical protein
MPVSSLSARCFPNKDRDFARDIAAAIEQYDGRLPLVLEALRSTYPQLRIVERIRLASLDGDDGQVWYCYRDGRPVPIGDGVGAMRAWTRIEALTNHSLDLIDWSGEAMREAQATVASARGAISAARR